MGKVIYLDKKNYILKKIQITYHIYTETAIKLLSSKTFTLIFISWLSPTHLHDYPKKRFFFF